MNTVACRRLTLGIVAVSCCLGSSAWGQDINEYFRRFNAHQDAGRHLEAEQAARQMLRLSNTESWRAASLNSLGRALKSQRRYDEAEAQFREALTIRLPSTNTNLGWIPNNLANVYNNQKRYDEAEAMYLQALAVFQRQNGETSGEVADVVFNLGGVFHDREEYDESLVYHLRALDIYRSVYGSEHVEVSESLRAVGDVHRHLKQFERAEELLQQAIAMQERLLGRSSRELAFSLNVLGMQYRDQERYSEAETVDRRVLAMREELLGPQDALVGRTLENLAMDLEKQGRPDEAATLRARAEQIAAVSGRYTDEGDFLPAIPKRVAVRVESADVRDGQQTIATVRRGQEFDVRQVNGKWYAIEVGVGGEKRIGWILNRDITPVAPTVVAAPPPAAETWQAFSPPGGRFTVSFPGTAEATTQTVNGVVNHAYTRETLAATFVVSYFDVPANKTLSFDAAIGAYTTARNGQVSSQQAIDLDLYPGREFAVELPNGAFSRLRLYTVGERWYQLIVEGDATAVNGDDANRFLGSFQLAD